MTELPEGVVVERGETCTRYRKNGVTLCGAFARVERPWRWAAYDIGGMIYGGESREEAEAACIEAARGE
jgi:hypothetical protein